MMPISTALSKMSYVDEVSQNSTKYLTCPRPYSLNGKHLLSKDSIKKRKQSKSFGMRCFVE